MKFISVLALISVACVLILSSTGHGVSEKLTAMKAGLTSPKSEAKEEETKEAALQTDDVPASLSDEQLRAIDQLKKKAQCELEDHIGLPKPGQGLPRPPGFLQPGSTMHVPAVADTNCCAGGMMALLFAQNHACARRKRPEANLRDHEKGTPPKIFANNGLCQRAMPHSSNENASPDFSGNWKCVKAEGDLDAFLKDLGKNFCKRKACAAFRFGAGSMNRQCEHVGNHLKVTQKVIGIPSLAQEWEIGKEEQEVVGKDEPFLQTAHWDPDDARVLVIESKDLTKSQPRTWSTSHQYFVDEDRFRVDSTSGGGHTASWIFQRQAPSGTQR